MTNRALYLSPTQDRGLVETSYDPRSLQKSTSAAPCTSVLTSSDDCNAGVLISKRSLLSNSDTLLARVDLRGNFYATGSVVAGGATDLLPAGTSLQQSIPLSPWVTKDGVFAVLRDPRYQVGIGIGSDPPQAKLHVAGGSIKADYFIGALAFENLTNVPLASFQKTGLVQIADDGSLTGANGLVNYSNSSSDGEVASMEAVSKLAQLAISHRVNSSGDTMSGNLRLLSSANLFLDSGAKLGIGTSTPLYDLDVQGDINFSGRLLFDGLPYPDRNTLAWNVDSRASNVIMSLPSSFNVGIGTSKPSFALDVAGGVRGNFFIGDGSSLSNLSIANLAGSTSNALPVQLGGTGSLTIPPHSVLFGNGSDPIGSSDGLVWIDSARRLGVNTSSPQHELDVNGVLIASSLIGNGSGITDINMDAASLGTLAVSRGGTGKTAFQVSKIVVGNGVDSLVSPVELHWDGSNSRLGIRNESPLHAVDVNGHVNATGFIGGGSNLTNLDASSVSYGVLSAAFGGTGRTDLTSNKLLIGAGSNAAALSPELLHWDGCNLGVGTSNPSDRLDVIGRVRASSFSGDGSGLTGVRLGGSNTHGLLPVNQGGTGRQTLTAGKLVVGRSSNALLTPVALHWEESNQRLGVGTSVPSETLDVRGTVKAINFDGDGHKIANLNVGGCNTIGILPVASGGTGASSLLKNKILIGDGSNAVLAPVALHYDTSNSNFGIGTESPSTALDVVGTVRATHFSGDGSNLQNLDASFVSKGVLAVSQGGTGASSLQNNRVLVGSGSDQVIAAGELTWTSNSLGVGVSQASEKVDVNGTVRALSFSGSGCNLRSLNASELTTGIANVTVGGTGRINLESGKVLVGNGSNGVRTPTSLHFDIPSASLGVGTNTPKARLDVAGTVLGTSFKGAGSELTDLDATNVTLGLIKVERGGTGASNLASSKLLVGSGSNAVVSPQGLHWDDTALRLGIMTAHPTSTLDVDGQITARSVRGNGSQLVGLDAAHISLGVLPVSHGGTGNSKFTPNKIIVGDDSNRLLSPSELHWTGVNLGVGLSNPTSRLDVFGRVNATEFSGNGGSLCNLNASSLAFGVVSVQTGGTGSTHLESSKILVGSGSNAILAPSELHWTGSNLGIGHTHPQAKMDVSGVVRATLFEGDGSALCNLDLSRPGPGGPLQVQRGGTGTNTLETSKLLVGQGSNAVSTPNELHWSSTNRRFGILTSVPQVELDVNGEVRASTGFSGPGSKITELDVSAVRSGELPVQYGGTGRAGLSVNKILVGNGSASILTPSDLHWDGCNFGVGSTNPASRLDVNGVVTATGFAGSASKLTELNVGGASAGVLSSVHGGTGLSSPAPGKFLIGNENGALLTPSDLTWTGSNLALFVADPVAELDVGGAVRAVAFQGSGASVTNLNMSAATTGVLPSKLGGTGNCNLSASKLLVGGGSSLPVSSPSELHWDAATKRLGLGTSTPADRLDVSGTVRATSFVGDGSALTNVNLNGSSSSSGGAGGPLGVPRGGSGKTRLTESKILVGNGLGPVQVPPLLHWDSSNCNLGVGTSNPAHRVDVAGTVRAVSFFGDGSALTNLDLSGNGTGVIPVSRGGTGRSNLARSKLVVGDGITSVSTPSSLHWDASNGFLGIGTANPTTTLDVAGCMRATSFAGSGASLTSLDAGHVGFGQLSARHGGTGQSNLQYQKLLVGNGSNPVQAAGLLHWDANSQFLGIGTTTPASVLDVVGEVKATSFRGNGANLVSLNVSNVAIGELAVNHGGTGLSNIDAGRFLVGSVSGSSLALPYDLYWDNGASSLGVGTNAPRTKLDVNGIVTGNAFVGSGSRLTGLNASNVTIGELTPAHGGLGRSNLAKSKLIVGDGSNAVLTPSELHWDRTSNFLGVGTSAPKTQLDVNGTVQATYFVGDGSKLTGLGTIASSGGAGGVVPVSSGGTGSSNLYASSLLVGKGTNPVQAASLLVWDDCNAFLGVGTSTPTSTLDVAGELRATSLVGGGAGITSLNANEISFGTLPVAHGGTGTTALQNGHVVLGGGSNALSFASGLFWDAADGYLGIGTTLPSTELDVNGTVKAAIFQGDGSRLTNVSVGGSNGILDIRNGGTGRSNLTPSKLLVGNGSNGVLTPVDLSWDKRSNFLGIGTAFPTSELDVSGTVKASAFEGDGSALSNVNLGSTTGLLAVPAGGTGTSNLPANTFVLGNGSNSLAGANGVTWDSAKCNLSVNGEIAAKTFSGDGSAITNIQPSNISLVSAFGVPSGGTGRSSLAAFKLLVGQGTANVLTPSGLHWDSSSSFLGVGTSTPSSMLQVAGTVTANSFAGALNADDVSSGTLKTRNGGTGLTSAPHGSILVGNGSGAPLLTPRLLTWDGSNLGVGTSNPLSTLDVRGGITSSSIAAFDASGLSNLSADNVSKGKLSARFGGTGATNLPAGSLLVGNGTDAIIGPSTLVWDSSNQYLGVGESSPQTALDVNGSVKSTTGFIGPGLGISSLDINSTSAGVLNPEFGGTGRGAGGNPLTQDRLMVGNGLNPVLTPGELVWSNASLGVRTLNPRQPLEVNGGVIADAFYISEGTGFKKYIGRDTATLNKLLVGNGSNGYLSPDTLSWDPANKYLGIGTSNPSAQLQVAGDTKVDGHLIANRLGVGSSNPREPLEVNGGVLAQAFYVTDSTGYRRFYGRDTVTANKLLVGNGSNSYLSPDTLSWDPNSKFLGIGTSSPAYKLHVNGNIHADGDVTSVSDVRVKTHLRPISDALAKLTTLCGYTYNRSDAHDTISRERDHLGLIAQEVLTVFPQAVRQDSHTGLYSINYGTLVAVLVESIKELKEENNTVKERVDRLEKAMWQKV